ncbi:MAG: Gmad2 immunoglobulin-like domain-containing protein [Anaerolineae bacterium]|nr:Gmad2 immunoglobulin-like domain-containing protein [Anaerolineae bacterium]
MTKPRSTSKSLSLTAILLFLGIACRFSNPLTTPTSTPVPTPTSTPARSVLPIAVPDELIHIRQPAVGSRLITPIEVDGLSGPTFEQTLIVFLTSSDGSQLALEPASIQSDIGEAGPFSLSLPFTVNAETTARLTVYDISARDGGLVHLNSLIITLLPSGSSLIVAAAMQKEAIHIAQPLHMEEIAGGEIHISGYAQYFFEATLNIAVCGSGGSGSAHLICGTQDNLLVEGIAMIASPDVGMPGPFGADIEYTVTETTRARLVVYAISPMDGAVEHLASQEIVLNP